MATVSRRAYAEMYGPTVGDRVRLADTGLLVEVEKDHWVGLWRTTAVASRSDRYPDLSYRVADDPEHAKYRTSR